MASTEEVRESGDLPKQEADKEKGVVESRPGAKMEEDLRGFNILFGVAEGLGLLTVILVLVWTLNYRGGFAWSSNPGAQFNWHPLLMTIGFIYLFGNSIMLYRAMRAMRKQQLKVIHAGIHTVVILCVIIAQVAVFKFHNALNIPNLYSLHSWIGMITTVFFVLQWLLSLLIFLYPGAPMAIRSKTMPWHVLVGLLLFVLCILAAVTGLLEKILFTHSNDYGDLPGEAVLVNILGLLFIIFGVLVVYIVTEPRFKRHPRPEDGALLTTSPSN